MTLQQHFSELRQRLIFSLIFFFITFCVCYFFSAEIYKFLLQPFIKISADHQNRRLIYTSLGEAFTTYLKLSFYSALFFSFPIFSSQLYLFLSPALFKKEKKNLLKVFFAAIFLFLFGAIFAYFFVLPAALQFFSAFETQGFTDSSFSIHLETRISEYLNFTTSFLFGFGIAFQLPILLLFLIRIDLLTLNDLRLKRRYWIVAIFVIAAILTPPDLLSQVSLAILLILLFEITILIGKNFNKKI